MKLILLTITLMVSGCLMAQNHNSKIIEAYGQQQFDQMNNNNPGMIELLNKYVEYGLSIEPMNAKYANVQELDEIKVRSKSESHVSISQFIADYNSSQFNPLEYALFPSTETQVYRLQGTNEVLVIYNQQTILNK